MIEILKSMTKEMQSEVTKEYEDEQTIARLLAEVVEAEDVASKLDDNLRSAEAAANPWGRGGKIYPRT